MKRVPPSFIKSYRPFRRFRYRCGLRRSFGNQIFPLAFKIHKCGDVRFPRLHICGIGLVIGLGLVEIFIGQTAETMAEFMNNHRPEIRMSRCGQRIAVIYASAAILRSVCQNYDMFIGYSGQRVMNIPDMQARQIAV